MSYWSESYWSNVYWADTHWEGAGGSVPDGLATPGSAIWWARFALSGDGSGSDPSGATLTALINDAVRTLCRAYPCVANDSAGASDSPCGCEGADIAAFHKALGLLAASQVLPTPAGLKFAAYVFETKIGPVTKRSSLTARDVGEAVAALVSAAHAAMREVSCVAESASAARLGGLYALTGYRRAVGCRDGRFVR